MFLLDEKHEAYICDLIQVWVTRRVGRSCVGGGLGVAAAQQLCCLSLETEAECVVCG